eukprot:CAMPEP_0205799110 /NCGR_PEP_ID=MMETSP0205-20121125/252_1 /ASSEMBLY_ACC=CAM_ASM_000278 /TAXON_ID=36767 /ORGANISM="Euplotes focardii, Strain TN1" /LENGTH=54 /DNA_ID=CAMNT_0053059837 /DNA_START=40 /DNA_END=204 /DNA_ORIENTATION=+
MENTSTSFDWEKDIYVQENIPTHEEAQTESESLFDNFDDSNKENISENCGTPRV